MRTEEKVKRLQTAMRKDVQARDHIEKTLRTVTAAAEVPQLKGVMYAPDAEEDRSIAAPRLLQQMYQQCAALIIQVRVYI